MTCIVICHVDGTAFDKVNALQHTIVFLLVGVCFGGGGGGCLLVVSIFSPYNHVRETRSNSSCGVFV